MTSFHSFLWRLAIVTCPFCKASFIRIWLIHDKLPSQRICACDRLQTKDAQRIGGICILTLRFDLKQVLVCRLAQKPFNCSLSCRQGRTRPNCCIFRVEHLIATLCRVPGIFFFYIRRVDPSRCLKMGHDSAHSFF